MKTLTHYGKKVKIIKDEYGDCQGCIFDNSKYLSGCGENFEKKNEIADCSDTNVKYIYVN